MPRRPTQSRPLTFSQFSRQAANTLVKRQVVRDSPPTSPGNESVKNKLKPKKEEDSESSEEQEFDGNVQVDFAFFDPKADDFHGVKTLMQTYLVALLVSQRATNLPPQLLPPHYEALFNEVSWATEDEPTMELWNSFLFTFYIIVTKFYKLKNSDKKRKHNVNEEGTIYVKPEDEIFHKLSSWSFEFTLNDPQIVPHELRNYQQTGLVMAVKADKITAFQQQLQSLIEQP